LLLSYSQRPEGEAGAGGQAFKPVGVVPGCHCLVGVAGPRCDRALIAGTQVAAIMANNREASIPFGDWAEEWRVTAIHLKPKTKAGYESSAVPPALRFATTSSTPVTSSPQLPGRDCPKPFASMT
jgi:hypothetical protein